MAWNGSGTFQRTNGTFSGATVWQDDKNAGFDIIPSRVDTHDQDIATGINNCLTKDGQNSATAPLNLGGNRIYNAGAATLRTDLSQVAQVQDGDFIWLGTTAGTATAQTASATPPITDYKNGQKFRMKPGFDSTGTTFTSHTLNVNALGTKAIIHQDGNSPTLGSWLTGIGRTLELVYNDGFFVVTSAPQYYQTWTSTLTPQAGTASSVTFVFARFVRMSNLVTVQLNVTWTQSLASATYIDIVLPVRPLNTQQSFTCALTAGATTESAYAYVSSVAGAGTVRCQPYNNGNILTGSKQLLLSGTYEIG